ncbi:GTPase HflX [Luteibaculum oceani]|uniref:GTPase HflX n=1 Tax=Luteibaculum oceani TaxID=1294296 RepID=A0A5C6UZY8_9FLAO|nr:GTPase HflX [Luteibaculum oceani]TXC78962.1 GTPase HflX [Luteibaculum oceani]
MGNQFKHFSTAKQRDKAVLVGVQWQGQTDAQLKEYLDELEFLADTAGVDVVKKFSQKLEKPHNKTFVGTGRLQEIVDFVKDNELELIIFDDELTPSQLRNLERELKIRVLDRTNLILDIFAQRASTSYARTQVELAQYEYLLPRLTRMWTHLERQKGGIGLRGPGETQIETDRRIMRDKISSLKKKLEKIDKQMEVQRSNRGAMVRVALVGYTNVGKSTIMNLLSKSEVFAENKLFATLDTTVRKIVIDNLPFLLSDTVGFIRKLPTQLVESFKSTLDEVREADVLVHVLDISHENFEEQFDVVNQTLADIKAADKPTLVVFNKIDQYKFTPAEEVEFVEDEETNSQSLAEFKNSWMAKLSPDKVIFISAINKTHIDELRDTLYDMVREIHVKRFPYNNFLY